MVQDINAALDRAEAEACIVILTGEGQVFSAGFDLKILRTGVQNAFGMLIGGFSLSRRLLSFPRPVILACNGHAIAMGAFILLSADYRIGVAGDFRIVANEVENGLTVPYSALTVCAYRLKPGFYDRAVGQSEVFVPKTAVEAGFLDKVVEADELMAAAKSHASAFAKLDDDAFKRTKLRMRKALLKKMSRSIWLDRLDFVRMGLARIFKR